MAFFQDHPSEPVPEEIFFWTFMVQGKITHGDSPTIRMGATPSGLISDPPPSSPIFMPHALTAATLPLYPGRHQICWLAYPVAWFNQSIKKKFKVAYVAQPLEGPLTE